MKRWMFLSMLVALLGACAVVPVGERYHGGDHDYYPHDYRNYDIRHYG